MGCSRCHGTLSIVGRGGIDFRGKRGEGEEEGPPSVIRDCCRGSSYLFAMSLLFLSLSPFLSRYRRGKSDTEEAASSSAEKLDISCPDVASSLREDSYAHPSGTNLNELPRAEYGHAF